MFGRLSKGKYFSKFDMRDGYNRLRVACGEEWKTGFRSQYGLYEYQVMPFGLCNAPGTFQHFVNDTFREYLDDFIVAYLNDLLEHSQGAQATRIPGSSMSSELRSSPQAL